MGAVGVSGSTGNSAPVKDSKDKAKSEKKEEPQPEAAAKKFEVVLTAIDDKNKIKIIKEVRNLLGLGLKESKDAVDKLPSSLKTGADEGDANKIKELFEGLGCKVELKN